MFDPASGLFMLDLLAWAEATQLDSWQRPNKTHGAALSQVLVERVRKSLNERGTLEVLRRGVELLGLKEPLMLAQFKPALTTNPAPPRPTTRPTQREGVCQQRCGGRRPRKAIRCRICYQN